MRCQEETLLMHAPKTQQRFLVDTIVMLNLSSVLWRRPDEGKCVENIGNHVKCEENTHFRIKTDTLAEVR